MSSVFLDNGVVFSYCLTVHEFHPECEEFVEGSDSELYITEEVDLIYARKKDEVIETLANSVLEHQASIKRGNFPDNLGPGDLNDIKKMLHRGNQATRFLLNWYDNQNWQFINKYELTEKLRDLAEDIETRAQERKSKFDAIVEMWERDEDHPTIQSDLDEIREDKEEDMWICIDAHDLAVNTPGTTDLATTDLDDFIRDGRKELILEATAIDDIIPVTNISV